MKRFLLTALLALAFSASFAQHYFQQEVNYTINVTLDDVNHALFATESIEYINNSPDNLEFIYMHLWPNAYKDHTTALCKQMMRDNNLSLYYADSTDRGFIDQLDFKVDGVPAKLEYDAEHPDVAKLILNKTLAPGAKITITTPFHVKIPHGKFSRLGHINQAYTITQWYPKPAVYDKNGWHQMPYLTQGEFYSEFGSFDVSVTLPKNYVLGATGDMVDGEEELEWLEEKVEQTEARSSFYPADMAFPESASETKTLRFKQSQVHDFAWFADKRYNVLKGEVELPNSKRKVTTWAMFTDAEADLWKRSIEYLNDATYYYSLWTGDYPYNHVTAVDGTISAGGGMEYPNITVIGTSGNDLSLETVIMHEVGHNWFYGILGSNERDHPWMDEGLNSYTENRYLETKYPKEGEQDMLPGGISNFIGQHLNHKDIFYLGYLFNGRRAYDQPIELHAAEYTQVNYGAIVYGKTALVFDYLKGYLGEETFDKCMRTYFDRWKFKHPQPGDVKAVFEDVSGKNLSWFFDEVINTNKVIDYKIVKAKDGQVTVKNVGDIAAPLNLCTYADGNVVKTQWFDGFEGTKTFDFAMNAGDEKYRIDGINELPEINRQNNTYSTSGLFKKVEPLQLKFLGSLEDPDYTKVYWTPTVGWNENDKWMLGAAIYNTTAPMKPFDYVIAPMYSFRTGSAAGYANVGFNFFPRQSKVFQSFRLEANASRFHSFYNSDDDRSFFQRVSPALSIRFKKKRLTQFHGHTLNFRGTLVEETSRSSFEGIDTDGTLITLEPTTAKETQHYHSLTYSFYNDRPLRPYDVSVSLHGHESFLRSELEFNYNLRYNKAGKRIYFRFFAGKFLYDDMTVAQAQRYRFRMDGQNGFTDYTYEGVFMDRSSINDFLGNQFIDNQGAFKVGTINGANADWLTALNVKAELPLPFRLKVGLFGDMGAAPITRVNGNTGQVSSDVLFLYDAGIYIPLAKNNIEVYFPLFFADEIADEIEPLNFGQRIRFIFNLHKVNPFNMARNIKP